MTELSSGLLNTVFSLERENIAVPAAIFSPFRLMLRGVALAVKGLAIFLIATTALIGIQEFQTGPSPSVLPGQIRHRSSTVPPGSQTMHTQRSPNLRQSSLSMAQQRSIRLSRTAISTRSK